MENNLKEVRISQKNESFIRWQGRSLEELGKAINLLLSLCLATTGFVVSKLLDKDFQFHNSCNKYIMIIGIIILLVTTILLLILIRNRLFSFKVTTKIARKREKKEELNIKFLRQEADKRDRRTWSLFKLSIITFIFGEAFVIISFIVEILSRP